MSTAHEIALNCLILGDDFDQGFVARIPEILLVADLKKFIKQEKENTFRDVDANDLHLFKVSLPTGRQKLEQSLSSLVLDPDQLLDPFDSVSEVFADGVPQKRIHILVKKPGEFLVNYIVTTYQLPPDDGKTLRQVKEQEDLLTGLANCKSFVLCFCVSGALISVV